MVGIFFIFFKGIFDKYGVWFNVLFLIVFLLKYFMLFNFKVIGLGRKVMIDFIVKFFFVYWYDN